MGHYASEMSDAGMSEQARVSARATIAGDIKRSEEFGLVAPAPAKGIPTALDGLEYNMDRLGAQLNSLEDRLGYVMLPPLPEPGGKSLPHDEPEKSGAAYRLTGIMKGLETYVNRVAEINARLDL